MMMKNVIFTGTGELNGKRIMACFEIDPLTGERLSKVHDIGLGCGGPASEAPHIFKKDGYYYYMLAEGGTEYGHRETIHRSKNIYGPYEACPNTRYYVTSSGKNARFKQ